MKYFKHESNALFNKKVRKLKREYKAEGYGVYFQMVELIANDIDKTNLQDWGFLPAEYLDDKAFLADEIGVEEQKLLEIIQYCYDIGLFENRDNRLYCSRVLESADEYTQKLIRSMEDKGATQSGVSRDNVGTESGIRREENRTEEEQNRKELELGASLPKNDVQIPDTRPKGVGPLSEDLKKRFNFTIPEKIGGISTAHQAKAFDYAKKLGIKLKDGDRDDTGRWIKIFKDEALQLRRTKGTTDGALSYCTGHSQWADMDDVARMNMFFKIYENGSGGLKKYE